MSSKQLNSILKKTPSATAKSERSQEIADIQQKEEMSRIVASIPLALKEEIREYIKKNKGETEKTVLLKALQKMGFNVNSSWIIDKRTLR